MRSRAAAHHGADHRVQIFPLISEKIAWIVLSCGAERLLDRWYRDGTAGGFPVGPGILFEGFFLCLDLCHCDRRAAAGNVLRR